MTRLHRLAEAIGVARHWRDAHGENRIVSDEVIAAVLGALGYPAGSDPQVAASLERHSDERRQVPALVTADAGRPIELPQALAGARQAEIVAKSGARWVMAVDNNVLPGVAEPGYHLMRVAGYEVTLAVAPPRCRDIREISSRKLWGPAVQIPTLRDERESAFGGFGELARAAALFADRGADAVAISPVHALKPGCGRRFSPYTPSSRIFLNAALADPALIGLPPLPPEPATALIDWDQALPRRYAQLRAIFAQTGGKAREDFTRWATSAGEPLRRHALFDALYGRFQAAGKSRWQDWPAAFHDPAGDAARRFAAAERQEIDFHLFAQWLTEQSLAAVQSRAKASGMAVGLIGDLAVGVDPGGSDGWAARELLLAGLTIGAPPDPLGPEGQNWALTTFSPAGLRASGFAPFIATLRAALPHVGGLRIDHVFGLRRLWVVPAGASAGEGAYLAYPFIDMLRLISLESHRAGAVIIGEDLGTMPESLEPENPGGSFKEALESRAMLGMRVLWFERDANSFRSSRSYPPQSVAMTGTHDLPTAAGWWRGRDLDWARKLGRLPTPDARVQAEEERAADRAALWSAIGDGGTQPAADDPGPAITAALIHTGEAASHLALVPLEDLLGIEEQPNIPGTIAKHPNWRRRLAAPLDDLIAAPETEVRIAALAEARRS